MTTTPENSSRRYLRKVFGLNPMWQAQDVIDLRVRAFKLTRLDGQESQADAVDLSQLRRAAKKHIATLQAEFWKLPLDGLKRQLEALDVRKLPELAPVVKRLRTAAACRGEFPRLAQESWMDLKLFDAFKSAVVLPPAEAGYVRERFLARLADKQQLKKVQTAVKHIESQFPVLFALEKDWFTTLKKHKVRRSGASDDSYEGVSISLPSFGWPAWLVIFFLIRFLMRLLATSGN